MEEKTEILAISNRYKDIFENVIDNLNIKPLDMPRPVNKKLYNIMPDSKNPLTKPKLKKKFLNKL